jgi:WD40 repeat protein
MSSMNLQKDQANQLLYVGFNQDNGCFACGTDNGFKIFNCDPFKETFDREFSEGGIGHVEMLFRCNILALVGGGRHPCFPNNKVMIWDDHQNRCIGELSFRTAVRAVKLRRDRVVVVLESKIYVYNFADLHLVNEIETGSNPKGLCALSPYSNNNVLVCPGQQTGVVTLMLYDQKINKRAISAHETAVTCLALSFDGTRLATASEKGTLVRIFDTATGNTLQEVRRGADRAEIYSIAFNKDCSWLAVSSDKGTVHIFNIGPKCGRSSDSKSSSSSDASSNPSQAVQEVKRAPANPRSSLSFFKNMLPKYFSSEWSFAQFRVPDVRTVVAFGPEKNSVIVVAADGTFFKTLFSPDKPGQEFVQESFAKFLPTKTTDKDHTQV